MRFEWRQQNQPGQLLRRYGAHDQELQFQPNPLHARVGDTITVSNRDNTNHTASADDRSFDTGQFFSGSKSIKLTKTGTVAYHCNVHFYMHGTFRSPADHGRVQVARHPDLRISTTITSRQKAAASSARHGGGGQEDNCCQWSSQRARGPRAGQQGQRTRSGEGQA